MMTSDIIYFGKTANPLMTPTFVLSLLKQNKKTINKCEQSVKETDIKIIRNEFKRKKLETK